METLPSSFVQMQKWPLHMAVSANNILEVRRLLAEGADVNVDVKKFCSPLHLAVDREQIEMVKILLEYGANPNLEALSPCMSPLHISVSLNNVELVQMLLDYGANTNGKMVLIAIENRSFDILKLLLEKGADPNYYERSLQHSPLHFALKYSYPAVPINIVKALIEAVADVNAANLMGQTALHLATCPDIVVCLLENGAQINARDIDGRTPLLLSIIEIRQKEKVIEPLLFAGANVNIPDYFGQTFKEVYESKKHLCKGLHDTMEKFRILKIRNDITKHFDKTNLKSDVFTSELESIKKTNVEGTCLYDVFENKLRNFVFCEDSTFRKAIRGDVFKNMFPHFHLLMRLSFRKAERNYFLRELSEMFSCKLTKIFQLNVPADIGFLIIAFLDAQDVNNLKLSLQ